MNDALIDVNESDAGLEVRTSDASQPVFLSWRWLRDHGEDEASRDPDTLQRRVDTFAIDPSATGQIERHDPNLGRFAIRWPDGAVTEHSHSLLADVIRTYVATDWLRALPADFTMPADVVLWGDPTAVAPDEIKLDAFLGTDDVLAHGVDQLSRYGYLILRGSRHNPKLDRARAEAFAERLGYIRHTIFGGMWDLSPDLTEHADTAYSSVYLGPHTDATYSHDAPGLQFFLCVQPAETGGESLVVDGFAIARELAESDPDAAAVLASVAVPGRYIEPGVHLQAERPVFRTDTRGVLRQVSFNNYDRAPFVLPPDREERFYRAYGRFAELANDPARRVAVSLQPGDVFVFDNWRAMHGRNAFTGYRHYIGAYLNHEDLESKRRVLVGA